ncbi:unnamed protein product [Angiostrongylus costaricensis]|uniref:Uncharacterized protein n=1 Tax=Angiostrongylus costaricensis TaxID=334426 RepID=A0A0R3PHP5_ANGCS|nr:unnamed protein product [Angiostrongylus costaricensis]
MFQLWRWPIDRIVIGAQQCCPPCQYDVDFIFIDGSTFPYDDVTSSSPFHFGPLDDNSLGFPSEETPILPCYDATVEGYKNGAVVAAVLGLGVGCVALEDMTSMSSTEESDGEQIAAHDDIFEEEVQISGR